MHLVCEKFIKYVSLFELILQNVKSRWWYFNLSRCTCTQAVLMVHRELKAIINLHQGLKGAASAGKQSCHCFCGNNNNFTTSCWVTNSLLMCTTRRTQRLFYNIQTLLKVVEVNEVLPTVFAVTELISAKIKWLLDYIILFAAIPLCLPYVICQLFTAICPPNYICMDLIHINNWTSR